MGMGSFPSDRRKSRVTDQTPIAPPARIATQGRYQMGKLISHTVLGVTATRSLRSVSVAEISQRLTDRLSAMNRQEYGVLNLVGPL